MNHPSRLQTVHSWHRKVQDQDIGFHGRRFFNRIEAVDSFRAHLPVWMRFQKMPDPAPEIGMVVGDHDSDRHQRRFSGLCRNALYVRYPTDDQLLEYHNLCISAALAERISASDSVGLAHFSFTFYLGSFIAPLGLSCDEIIEELCLETQESEPMQEASPSATTFCWRFPITNSALSALT